MSERRGINQSSWVPRVARLLSGQYAYIGNSEELCLTTTEGFAIEAWVRLDSCGVKHDEVHCIISSPMRSTELGSDTLLFFIRGGHPVLCYGGSSASPSALVCPTKLEVSVWYHLAVAFRSGKRRILVNGKIAIEEDFSSLAGSCPLYVGGYVGAVPSASYDLCELRVWNYGVSSRDIRSRRKIAISPSLYIDAAPDSAEFHVVDGLRLSWLPLRAGGARAKEIWSQSVKLLTSASAGHALPFVAIPSATLLWDRGRREDAGRILRAPHLSTPLITSRLFMSPESTMLHAVLKVATVSFQSALALLDEWSDAFDLVFLPQEAYGSSNADNKSQHPSSSYIRLRSPFCDESEGAMAAARDVGGWNVAADAGQDWAPRVLKVPSSSPTVNESGNGASDYSVLLGSATEIGIVNGAFTFELWLCLHPSESLTGSTRNILQVRLSDDLTQDTSKELIAGLLDGRPFIAQFASSDVSSSKAVSETSFPRCLIADKAVLPGRWTHLAFVSDGNGGLSIFMNGDNMCTADKNEEEKTNVVRHDASAVAGGKVVLFGGKLWARSPALACEVRLWGRAKSAVDINSNMRTAIHPGTLLQKQDPKLEGIRLAWLPLKSRNTLLWDATTSQAVGSCSGWKFPMSVTRRPSFIPPSLVASVSWLPQTSALDEHGDTYEKLQLPKMAIFEHDSKNVASASSSDSQVPGDSIYNSCNLVNRVGLSWESFFSY